VIQPGVGQNTDIIPTLSFLDLCICLIVRPTVLLFYEVAVIKLWLDTCEALNET